MSQAALMRSRRFLPLFATQFLGAFNDNVFRFALIIFVTFTVAEQTGMDTRMLVVTTGGVFILPFFLLSALAGQLADKLEKARLIRHVKTSEVLVMALGAVGFVVGDYLFLLAVLFLMGAQSTFFGPLKYGVLPQHLTAAELTGGNGLIQMGTYVAILTGGIAGGMLASLGEDSHLAVIAAVVGLAVLGRIAAAFIPPAAPSDPGLSIDFNPLRSTCTLMTEAGRRRDILVLIGLISLFWFIGATYLSVVPTFGKTLLNADERAVTLLSAAFTVGIGLGSLSAERLSRGRIELGLVLPAGAAISLASFDVWLAGAPAARTAVLTAGSFFSDAAALRFFADLVIIGAAGALYIVPLYAALQNRAVQSQCARRLAALNVMNALFMVGAAGFTMALYAGGVDEPGVFGIVGILNLGALWLAARAMPELPARLRYLGGRRPDA